MSRAEPKRVALRPGTLFGAGEIERLPSLVKGRSALLVTTPGWKRRGLVDRLRSLLEGDELRVWDRARPNPGPAEIESFAATLSGSLPELILAIGGGSAIDTAKALAWTLPQEKPSWLRLRLRDGASRGAAQALPIVAVPTTAGTGSEMTPFATLWDHEARSKLSLESPELRPEAALLDPELTVDLPREVTLHSGLDALIQALEAIWSRRASDESDPLAERAAAMAFAALPAVLESPHRIDARGDMLAASSLAGMAIGMTRTALCHSISYPLTAHWGLAHGLACAVTLPAVLRFNSAVAGPRLDHVAQALGARDSHDLADRLADLIACSGAATQAREAIPSERALVELAPRMLAPGRAENNVRLASVEDVEDILRESWRSLEGESIPSPPPADRA